MWGMDLVRKGIAWGVGDDNMVTMFGHQWIPGGENLYLNKG